MELIFNSKNDKIKRFNKKVMMHKNNIFKTFSLASRLVWMGGPEAHQDPDLLPQGLEAPQDSRKDILKSNQPEEAQKGGDEYIAKVANRLRGQSAPNYTVAERLSNQDFVAKRKELEAQLGKPEPKLGKKALAELAKAEERVKADLAQDPDEAIRQMARQLGATEEQIAQNFGKKPETMVAKNVAGVAPDKSGDTSGAQASAEVEEKK